MLPEASAMPPPPLLLFGGVRPADRLWATILRKNSHVRRSIEAAIQVFPLEQKVVSMAPGKKRRRRRRQK